MINPPSKKTRTRLDPAFTQRISSSFSAYRGLYR